MIAIGYGVAGEICKSKDKEYLQSLTWDEAAAQSKSLKDVALADKENASSDNNRHASGGGRDVAHGAHTDVGATVEPPSVPKKKRIKRGWFPAACVTSYKSD